MSRKKVKPEPEPLPFFLELEVVARPWHMAPTIEKFIQRRDLYLHRRDPKDPAARMPFLQHVDCPIDLVRQIIQWAEAAGTLIVQTPPGNLEVGWKWPFEPSMPTKAEASF